MVTFVVEASTTSLDVERKHQQDKRSEKRRVSTLPRMSRNSILQRYNVMQQKVMDSAKTDAAILKWRTMSATALAFQMKSELVSRPRGHLRWQGAAGSSSCAKKGQREIVHEGDMDELKRWTAENRDMLDAKAKTMRDSARDAQRRLSNKPDVPVTNLQWVNWLDSHDEEFRDALNNATARRKVLRDRVIGDPSEPTLPRLQPVVHTAEMPKWMKKLLYQDTVAFAVSERAAGGEEQTSVRAFLATTVVRVIWALELHRVGRMDYTLPHETDFSTAIQRLTDLSADWDVEDDTDVHALKMNIQMHDDVHVRFRVVDFDVVPESQRSVRAGSGRKKSDDVVASDSEAADSCPGDSDASSIPSAAETFMEDDMEERALVKHVERPPF